jgi:hypothetical protein
MSRAKYFNQVAGTSDEFRVNNRIKEQGKRTNDIEKVASYRQHVPGKRKRTPQTQKIVGSAIPCFAGPNL